MQTTTARYKTILAGAHWFEIKISIAGNEIGEAGIVSIHRSRPGMPDKRPSAGAALASTLTLRILKPNFTIPRMAEIDCYIRIRNASQTDTVWLAQGVYFIDTRRVNESSDGVATVDITAYDAIMKTEADYPDTAHDWPYLDKNVVAEIASTIGVTVDARTNQFLTAGYMIELPVNYTMREKLEHIAASYGGNFVVTSDNKLLFVPLYGFDYTETGYYLADENGNALVFGNEGWFILV